jgi:VanZ family protein
VPNQNTKLRPPSWLLNWFPVLFCVGLIFYFSSRSSLPQPIAEPSPHGEVYRQMIHMFEYAVLTGFLYRALANRERNIRPPESMANIRRSLHSLSLFGISVALAVLYAVFDEWHQSFVPNPDPSLRDVAADKVGVALALVVIALVSLWMQRRDSVDDREAVKIVLVLPAQPSARGKEEVQKQRF